jgi:hypothetical protein
MTLLPVRTAARLRGLPVEHLLPGHEYQVDAEEVLRVCRNRRTEDTGPQFVPPLRVGHPTGNSRISPSIERLSPESRTAECPIRFALPKTNSRYSDTPSYQ